MTALVEALNTCGDWWLGAIWERSLCCAVVFTVVGITWLLVRRRSSAHTASYLFLVPLIPLIAPVERMFPSQWASWSPRSVLEQHVPLSRAPEPTAAPAGELLAATTASSPAQDGAPPVSPSPEAGPAHAEARVVTSSVPGIPALAMLGWLSIVSVLLLRLSRNHARAARLIRAGRDLSSLPVGRLARGLGRSVGVAGSLRVLSSKAALSPASCGWRRPVIVLPPGLEDRLSEHQLRWVLLHELAHLRRHDVESCLVQQVLQIFYFFHPLVWLTNSLVAHHRECACDDAAAARTSQHSLKPCASALLEVVARTNQAFEPQPALTSLIDHKTHIRKRLMRLLDSKRTVTRGISPGALGLILSCALLGLAAARAQQPETPRLVGQKQDAVRTPATADEARARQAIQRSIDWLRARQRSDGGWGMTVPKGSYTEHNEMNVTGLALLALMKSQAVRKQEATEAAIKKGVRFLVASQDPRGAYGKKADDRLHYGHAVATIALAQAHKRAPEASLKTSLDHAVKYILMARNPYKAWRYGPRSGDNDSKVTSAMLMALEEAESCGISVEKRAYADGLLWLVEMTDPQSGRTGFMKRGGYSPRMVGKIESFPRKATEEMTAFALNARMACGERQSKSSAMRKGIDLLMKSIPEWSEKKGTIDFGYWFFGMRLMAKAGGFQQKVWRAAVMEALVPNQKRDESGRGYWPGVDAWSHPGLEVYATALGALTLDAAINP